MEESEVGADERSGRDEGGERRAAPDGIRACADSGGCHVLSMRKPDGLPTRSVPLEGARAITRRTVVKPERRSHRAVKALVLYAVDEGRRTLSYQQGWPAAFARDPRFDAKLVNVMSRSGRLAARLALSTRGFDAIVVLHSVLSNEGVIFGRLLEDLTAHEAPKAYFIGNEYKLMPQKMEFSEQISVSLLVSMVHSRQVHRLYRERLGCEVVEIPSAGVDRTVFSPLTDLADRPVDLGMRAYEDPLHLGHRERRTIGTEFAGLARERGFVVDVSFDPRERFAPEEYAAFLNRCRGQLGTEAGGDFFELSDDLFRQVVAYTEAHPEAELNEIWPLFFADYEDPVSARSITGRHTEAAATKTVQILFDGEYSGFFEPDIHYLALRKDLSNAEDVLDRFQDDALCREVADNAYRVATEELTYERLLDRFIAALRPLLPRHPVRRRVR